MSSLEYFVYLYRSILVSGELQSAGLESTSSWMGVVSASSISITFSVDASFGRFFTPFFRMSRTWSGDISEEPSLTLADAVMFVGLPEMVISLSNSIPTA